MLVPTIANTLVKGELRLPNDFEFRWWKLWHYRWAMAKVIRQHNLKIVGVMFKLVKGSFSAAYMLLESGVEAHLWPELQTLQLTVHLCDYSRDNHQLTIDLFYAIAKLLGCDMCKSTIMISRLNEDNSVELSTVVNGVRRDYAPVPTGLESTLSARFP